MTELDDSRSRTNSSLPTLVARRPRSAAAPIRRLARVCAFHSPQRIDDEEPGDGQRLKYREQQLPRTTQFGHLVQRGFEALRRSGRNAGRCLSGQRCLRPTAGSTRFGGRPLRASPPCPPFGSSRDR